MDCKNESAATTLVRIEVLVLQGLARTMLLFLFGIVVFPVAPFLYASVRLGETRETMPQWKRIALIPLWFVFGIAVSLLAPFVSMAKGIALSKTIASVEWHERWRCGVMKHPDGKPMSIPDANYLLKRDIAITQSVIEDYNEEALEHGQGIPPIGK